ncbi:MAG: hypothetical protein J1F35_00235 [Erysipelotrichales bacterium]|nr:hypothetical protein [Erysipelotrichales bacterium]
MATRKKVDKVKEEFERKIEIFKKNNAALCDMLALYSYFVIHEKNFDPAGYITLEAVIKDLEDPDINVPFKADTLESMVDYCWEQERDLLRELKETKYYKRLESKIREDYRTNQIRMFFAVDHTCSKQELLKKPYDFIGNLCEYSCNFISEILCSDMPVNKKIDVFYDVLMYYIKNYYKSKLEHLLSPTGAGHDLSRTKYTDKEKKINKLLESFKNAMDKDIERKKNLFEAIATTDASISARVDILCYLESNNIVDFMNLTHTVKIDGQKMKGSIITCISNNNLDNLKQLYELDEYNNLSEKIRRVDDLYILSSISIFQLASFIKLSNYNTSIEDIRLIAKRVLEYQIDLGRVREDVIADIKDAIIHKARDKKEFKIYCELADLFIKESDYKQYKKDQEEKETQEEKIREQQIAELENAQYQLYLRLYNMNESLQEQVPGKKVIKELTFKKPSSEN